MKNVKRRTCKLRRLLRSQPQNEIKYLRMQTTPFQNEIRVFSCDMCVKIKSTNFAFPTPNPYHFLTYVASDKSHPLTLLKSFSSQKPIRVFRSSSGNREKGKYFPIPSENKVVYRYDGIYYVVATINKKNGEFVGIGGEVVDARVFFLVRMEPSVIMQRLRMEHPSLNLCLPLLDEHDSSGYSGRDSTEIVDAAWDAKAFHEWNPLGTRI